MSHHPGSVEQISLHCAEGSLEWLYPKGALRLSLSPRLPSAVVGPVGSGHSTSGHITACIKPAESFLGAQLYLERDGVLELLVGDWPDKLGPPRVRCFSRQPGERLALFLQATPHQDISRRIAAFRYELRGDWNAGLSLESDPIRSEGEISDTPRFYSDGRKFSVMLVAFDLVKSPRYRVLSMPALWECRGNGTAFSAPGRKGEQERCQEYPRGPGIGAPSGLPSEGRICSLLRRGETAEQKASMRGGRAESPAFHVGT